MVMKAPQQSLRTVEMRYDFSSPDLGTAPERCDLTNIFVSGGLGSTAKKINCPTPWQQAVSNGDYAVDLQPGIRADIRDDGADWMTLNRGRTEYRSLDGDFYLR
jgi:hypothetical protein